MSLTYSQYTVTDGLQKLKTRTAVIASAIALIFGGGLSLAMMSLSSAGAAATQVIVSPANNQGWILNPDPTTSTTYEFTADQSSIGYGSLYAGPIDNLPDGKDKFIAAKELKVPVTDFGSFSYDFLIAGDGTSADANQFYLNVYATVVNDDKFYDCRYDYVAPMGSTTDFTTATITAASTPVNVQKSGTARIAACPATLDQLSSGFVRAVAVNMGDTTLSDTDLAGYFDKFVVTTAGNQTTYDFEPYVVASNKDECKKDGWMSVTDANGQPFKNQGQCVAYTNRG